MATTRITDRQINQRNDTVTAGTTSLDSTFGMVLCNAVGGAIVLNLPAAAANIGRSYTINKIDASTNTVTINGSGAETINGVTPLVIAFQWTSLTIVCDGIGWYII